MFLLFLKDNHHVSPVLKDNHHYSLSCRTPVQQNISFTGHGLPAANRVSRFNGETVTTTSHPHHHHHQLHVGSTSCAPAGHSAPANDRRRASVGAAGAHESSTGGRVSPGAGGGHNGQLGRRVSPGATGGHEGYTGRRASQGPAGRHDCCSGQAGGQGELTASGNSSLSYSGSNAPSPGKNRFLLSLKEEVL